MLAAAVAVLAAAVYANALANELVWDDPIVLTRQLRAFQSLRDVVFPPRNIPQFSPDYYRPLTTLSYLVDRAVGGSRPFMFHLSVLLYHVLATYLVFRLGLVLFRRTEISLAAAGLGAALFAVHPIHTESVAWGAGRSDVLACVLGIAGALAYLHERWPPPWRAIVSALLLLAATLAKETAVPLLLLVPATPLILGTGGTPPARQPRGARRRQAEVATATRPLLLCLPFAAVLLVYVLLRSTALETLLGQSRPLDAGAVVTVLGALSLYIAKLVLPLRQCAYISELPTAPLLLAAVGAGLVAALACGVLAWRRGSRPVVWLLLWIGLTLAPSLAIPFKLPAVPVAERYLYLPSVGFCLLVGDGAARVLRAVASRPRRAAVIVVIAAVLGSAAAATAHRNGVWHDNMSLWTDTTLKNTTDGLPLRSLGTAHLNQGNRAAAAEYLRLALQRHNDAHGLLVIHNNLGSLALQEQNLDAAEGHYNTALSIDPNSPDALFNLGLIALTRGMHARDAGDAAATREQAALARSRFEHALHLNPHDPDPHIALGQTLTLLNDPAGARSHYDQALSLGPPSNTERAVRKLLAELK